MAWPWRRDCGKVAQASWHHGAAMAQPWHGSRGDTTVMACHGPPWRRHVAAMAPTCCRHGAAMAPPWRCHGGDMACARRRHGGARMAARRQPSIVSSIGERPLAHEVELKTTGASAPPPPPWCVAMTSAMASAKVNAMAVAMAAPWRAVARPSWWCAAHGDRHGGAPWRWPSGGRHGDRHRGRHGGRQS
jgi:hypothetical protein